VNNVKWFASFISTGILRLNGVRNVSRLFIPALRALLVNYHTVLARNFADRDSSLVS
jgi:hypothetical protein